MRVKKKRVMGIWGIAALVLIIETAMVFAQQGSIQVFKYNDTNGAGNATNTTTAPPIGNWTFRAEFHNATSGQWIVPDNATCETDANGHCFMYPTFNGSSVNGTYRVVDVLPDRTWVPTGSLTEGYRGSCVGPYSLNFTWGPGDVGDTKIFANWQAECNVTAVSEIPICEGEPIDLIANTTEGIVECTQYEEIIWGARNANGTSVGSLENLTNTTATWLPDGFVGEVRLGYRANFPGDSWCQDVIRTQVNPLPECMIEAPGPLPVPDGSNQTVSSAFDNLTCAWDYSGDVANAGNTENCTLPWTASYSTGYALFNLTVTDNNTCASECSANVTVAPPIELGDPVIESTDPGSGRVCLSLNITGGYPDPLYNTTWDPTEFVLDNGTGLWCGNLPPCSSALVTVNVTDVIGSAPKSESIFVSLECAVPTLNEWGLIAFMILMAATGAWFVMRRKKSA